MEQADVRRVQQGLIEMFRASAQLPNMLLYHQHGVGRQAKRDLKHGGELVGMIWGQDKRRLFGFLLQGQIDELPAIGGRQFFGRNPVE